MNEVVNLGDIAPVGVDGSKTALIDLSSETPVQRTYDDMERRQRAVARALLRSGYRRGQRVAILSLNRGDYLDAYFGIMRAGLVAVPVNIRLPDDAVRYVLQDSAAVFAFCDAERRSVVGDTLPAVTFGREFDNFLDHGSIQTVEPAAGEIAMLLYTSGSSGRPKGVPLTHEGQLWALALRRSITAAPSAQRYIIAAPLFHMNALFNAKTALFAGASMVLMPHFSAREYLTAAARYDCTSITTIPTMMARALKEQDLLTNLDLSKIGRIGLGSAPCTESLRDAIQRAFPAARVLLSYGTTEAGPAVFGPHPEAKPQPPMSLGYPLPGSEVRLVGGSSPDEGVLEMRNPAVMPGYNNLPELTAKVLKNGWYYSGDVMRRDADGFYYFVGRADDMFVCNGENVFPGEVERVLESHPGVLQACVVPADDEERGQIPVAFVVLRTGAQISEQDLKKHALAHGPAYQHPRVVKLVRELPLAGTNKIDRRKLAHEAHQIAQDRRGAAAEERAG